MDMSLFAVRQLPDGRWEIIGPDEDPRRPPWRRIAIVGPAGEHPGLTAAPKFVCGPQSDLRRLRARRLLRIACARRCDPRLRDRRLPR
jgi:hypothetical protein